MQAYEHGLAKETLMELFAKAKKQLESRRAFVLFRKPGEHAVNAWLQRDATQRTNEPLEGSGFVFAPFHQGPTLFLNEQDCDIEQEVFNLNADIGETPQLSIDESARIDFEKLVNKAVEEIRKGAFRKVVVSRTESVAVDDFDVFAAFSRLLSAYPSAFVYLWFHPSSGLWMAATPERLLQSDGSEFRTMALAGTQPFQGELVAQWPAKEKEEQRLVTEFIQDGLQTVATSLEVGTPYTFRAGNLLHIRTDIRGTLAHRHDLASVVRLLHPTPAVCGLPREKALGFLLSEEHYDRRYYAGFLGELNVSGHTDLYVNLRCMHISAARAQLFMGCGITKDSDAGKEFFETVNKSLTIRKALDTASGPGEIQQTI